MIRRTVVAAAVAICAAALGACGLPIDERVQTFDDVPYDLDAPTTTTTTTEVPPTMTTEQGAVETSTTIVETRPVDVVYLLGGSGELQPITVALPTPVNDRLIIEQLTNPPAGTGIPLRTEVERGLITGFTVDRGLAIVDLSPSVIARLSSLEQRRAIAQIVLTLTLFTTAEGGIGQVSFTVDDEPISVYVPARGSNSDPGEAVAWSDYASLLAGAPDTTTTTRPPNTTTTSSVSQPTTSVAAVTTTTAPTIASSSTSTTAVDSTDG